MEDRSIMNVTFVMKEEYKEKEADFLAFATEQGNVGTQRTQVGWWFQGIHLQCHAQIFCGGTDRYHERI